MVHLIADDFKLDKNTIQDLTLFLDRIYNPEYYEIKIVVKKEIEIKKEKKEDIFDKIQRQTEKRINEKNISEFAKEFLNENTINKTTNKTKNNNNNNIIRTESYYLKNNWKKTTFGLSNNEILMTKKFNFINNFNFNDLQRDWIIKSPEFEIEQRKDTYTLLITCKNKSEEFNKKLKKAIIQNFTELKIRGKEEILKSL